MTFRPSLKYEGVHLDASLPVGVLSTVEFQRRDQVHVLRLPRNVAPNRHFGELNLFDRTWVRWWAD